MTPSTDEIRHGQRLRLRDVAALDDRSFALYIGERFDQLVTAAIADADGRLRPTQHTVLRAPERLQRLRDALTFAEGDLQVGVERMTYQHDARAARTARLLRRVRNALHEVNREAAAARHAEARRREAGAEPPVTDVIATARSWLVDALPDHFHRHLAQTLADAGLPARPAAVDVFDTVEEGWHDGHLTAPRTPQVDELLAKGPVAFRGLVADDARAQGARVAVLRHPLLQRRWAQALAELTHLTVPVARASSNSALGPLPDGVYDMPETDAYRIFNARRLLTAVWQRQSEHKRLLHQYATAVTEARRTAPEEDLRRRAVGAAIDRLVNEQPAAAARVVTGLCPHITGDGLIELQARDRIDLKRRLVAEARSAAQPPPQLDTALPPAPPARTALPATAVR
ncbi:hypothetical protein GCM10022244_13070 [Streptomyces gulbargensis]|uniref:Uncharacterized protein n=1 Tax=Streptomyces gulbargensis TaxID=364901 RepID=A0ABP7LNA7_9ACTN